MIFGLFAIVFLSAAIRGATELRKHSRKQLIQNRPKPSKLEKQDMVRRYFFWESSMNRLDSHL